jgi:pimeloyl-ACP methyl ester carboxylesterase
VNDSNKFVTMPPPRPDGKPSGAANPFRPVLQRTLLVIISFAIGFGLYACLRPVELLLTVVQVKLRLDGITSEFVSVDGYRIHYYTGGSGPPIVLVHGLGGRAEDWGNLMPQLVHGGHRVFALDLLGYGRSARPRGAAYSIPQEAGIVEKFIADQNLDRTDVAGWSMGGWIAMRIALDEPEHVRRVAIYDSAGLRYDVPFDTSLFWPDNPTKLATLRDLLSPGIAPAVPALIQRDIFRLTRRNGWIVQRSMQSMLTGADVLDGKLAALKMPVLIVWGKQDKVTPVAVAYTIHAQVPQSVLEIYDGCGHLAARECSDRIAPNTVGFFNAEPPLAAQIREIPAGK